MCQISLSLSRFLRRWALAALVVSSLLKVPALVSAEEAQTQRAPSPLAHLPAKFEVRFKLKGEPQGHITQKFIDGYNAQFDRVEVTTQNMPLHGNANGGGGGSTISAVNVKYTFTLYLPEDRYEGLGRLARYQDFPRKVQETLMNAQTLLESVGIRGPLFWDKFIVDSMIAYRASNACAAGAQ